MKLFETAGRINRAPYIGYTIGMNVLSVILFIVLIIVLIPFMPADGEFDDIDAAAFESAAVLAICAVMVLYFILTTILYVTLSIQRLHDLEKDGMFVLLAFVPTVNFIFWLYLCIMKGTDGPNQYGEDPLGN
ncbi:MAG: DUF805 domain-containing protein [Selenomonadaceae bacterium]|nr:DUF805 domain-containing protein [Selenomonadaceae bacterium]